ncbi:MAG: hypothetical protein IKJ17_02705 [Clostridia bacterium]|nr:hypothetical protein [Clostridia bacterium]
MKRLLTILLCVALLFSFAGCTAHVNNGDEVVTETTSEWKKFLKEYESWVDTYVSVTEKYSENPSDPTVLADYTNMTNDMVKWQMNADKIAKELSDSEKELAEYTAELARIVEKLG